MNNQKIIVLDFVTSEVHVFPFDRFVYEDGEQFVSEDPYEAGLNLSNCQYMVVDELNITVH